MANEIKVEISAKFEEGGAPSIKTIVKEIDNVYKTPSQEEKKVIDVKENTKKLVNTVKLVNTKKLVKLVNI